MEFTKLVLLSFYTFGISLVLGINDFSSFIESSSISGRHSLSEYDLSKTKEDELFTNSKINHLIKGGLLSSIEHNQNNDQQRYKSNEFNPTNSFCHHSTELSENLGISTSLLFSPIMGKSTAILGELSFRYSLDGIRNGVISAENYSPDKLAFKLFGPNGAKNNAFGPLRYGFLNALMNEINSNFPKKTGFRYKLHSKLLVHPLNYNECVNLLIDTNKQMQPFLTINEEIFKIICEQVTKNNSFIEMQSWNSHILEIIGLIKKSIYSIQKMLDAEKDITRTNDLLKVPKIKVSGTEIKARYLNIVKCIYAIKKKEQELFKSLIFTKNIAVKISTLYLPNGYELIQKCIEIIKSENPALMREVYQREKIEQICKMTMGS